jgi:uncharacterized protein YjbJ (UPF0337 family)
MPEARQNNSKLAEMLARVFRALVGMAVDVVDLFMALLSFVESAPRAYRLKASNAAPPFSTSAGTSAPDPLQVHAKRPQPGDQGHRLACHRITMDWNRVEGNWKQTKGKIKEKWGQLTDDDLTQINGKRDQLEGKIQERYGLAKDRARKDIDEWLSTVQ